jgi:glutamyl-Q tRNA(Asp) synthetase
MGSHSSPYIGRFAPSPTGNLHFGSLVAALASFLDARAHDGLWLLRIEDIDPPREQPGATSAILKSLEAHHLFWDGDVLYQSQRSEAYRAALQTLETQQLSYRCTCSRQTLPQHDEQHSSPSAIYSGHCRHLRHDHQTVSATRLNLEKSLRTLDLDPVIHFDDLWQSSQKQNLLSDVGDFVIHRKDGLFAYQLAVVIDDILQNITHVIRGADLLDSTARQILLFRLFSAPVPVFGHVPLVLNSAGQKLSKQNLAAPLDDNTPTKNIFAALQFLQLNPPPELQHENIDTALRWALTHWPH